MAAYYDDPIDQRGDGDEDCLECHGSGWILTCCDDICHGIGYCMHGDGEAPCPSCRRAQYERARRRFDPGAGG